jgi:hypothetical protein
MTPERYISLPFGLGVGFGREYPDCSSSLHARFFPVRANDGVLTVNIVSNKKHTIYYYLKNEYIYITKYTIACYM